MKKFVTVLALAGLALFSACGKKSESSNLEEIRTTALYGKYNGIGFSANFNSNRSSVSIAWGDGAQGSTLYYTTSPVFDVRCINCWTYQDVSGTRFLFAHVDSSNRIVSVEYRRLADSQLSRPACGFDIDGNPYQVGDAIEQYSTDGCFDKCTASGRVNTRCIPGPNARIVLPMIAGNGMALRSN